MPLPKFEYPIYTLTVPSTNEEIKFRPFTVKEQKNLMSVLEFKETSAVINAMEEIIKVCTFDKLLLNNLESYDVEYVFIQIKARSTGDKLFPTYVCRNKIDGKECGTKIKTSINLLETKIIKDDSIDKTIHLTDTISVKFKYPKFNSYFKHINIFGKDLDDIINIDDLLFECIDTVYDDDKIYKPDIDFTMEEAKVFFESFTPSHYEKLTTFFSNIPRIEYKINLKCPSCGTHEKIELNGINDFLD
jgi:hypothetical protein